MARAKSNRGQSWSVRYYLCSGDQIAWRIPNTLLKDLAAGKLALPQFAGAKQKVLEAFVGGARGAPVLLDACGSYFSFASDGSLDVHPEAEALSSIIEGARPRRVQAHVIDIGPTVRHRRWVKDRTWRATATMLRAVRIDLSGTVQPGAKKLPLLKRLLKDLAAGKLTLPQFAGTKQKVLEAFVGRAGVRRFC